MNIVAIVQARTGSTRLHNKVLKKIKNKKILDYVIERVKLSKKINNVVLAITKNPNEDILEKYAIEKKIKYHRGSENDVLERFYKTAKKYNAEIIVRITSDCPLIDPNIIDEIIKAHLYIKSDYTSNTIYRTFPRGMDTEVFSFKVLEYTFNNAKENYQREHVTPYIRENPDKFKLKNIEAVGILKRPDLRLTVDTIEDYKLIKIILEEFNYINFKLKDIITFLNNNETLLDINKSIKQKEEK